MTPRGIRLNNPGNIVRGADKWQGMTVDQPDPRFIKFQSPEFGIRAIARILLKYRDRGLCTVQDIIATWAPPSENDTKAYVNAVCATGDFMSYQKIDVDDAGVASALVKAIVLHENGVQPYPDNVIQAGLRLAGVYDAAPKPLIESRTMQGSAAVGAGAGLAAVSEVTRQIQDVQMAVQPALDAVSLLREYGVWAAVAVAIGAAAYIAYARYSDRKRLGH